MTYKYILTSENVWNVFFATAATTALEFVTANILTWSKCINMIQNDSKCTSKDSCQIWWVKLCFKKFMSWRRKSSKWVGPESEVMTFSRGRIWFPNAFALATWCVWCSTLTQAIWKSSSTGPARPDGWVTCRRILMHRTEGIRSRKKNQQLGDARAKGGTSFEEQNKRKWRKGYSNRLTHWILKIN